MKKLVLFDPSYGSSNLGDFIINEAVMNEMDFLFSKNYLIRYSTHSPLMHLHQLLKKNFISRNCDPLHLKFLGGSNIFKQNLLKYTLDWNINIFTKSLYRNSVSIGGGCEGSPLTINRYTRYIYKTVLSEEYVHSVRDQQTEKLLKDMGLKAINTGCPTTWRLSREHCADIPTSKSNSVIFTLTDYSQNREKDQKLIDTLLNNYSDVLFWIQGTEDYDYFRTFSNIETIELINPNLESYRKVLLNGKIDYVGTRLHAGIFAMQHKVRSIILIVDNRARDMQKSYNINAVERDDINQLEAKINSEFKTEIQIDEGKIREWKSQFIAAD